MSSLINNLRTRLADIVRPSPKRPQNFFPGLGYYLPSEALFQDTGLLSGRGYGGRGIPYHRNLAIQSPALFRCVTMISGHIASLIKNNLRVLNKNNEESTSPSAERAIMLLMSMPDGISPARQWIEDVLQDYLLDGNALVFVEKSGSKVLKLHHMYSWASNSASVAPSPDDPYSEYLYQVRYRRYPNLQLTIPESEICHIRWPKTDQYTFASGTSDRFCASPLYPLSLALQIALGSDEWIRAFFDKDQGSLKSDTSIIFPNEINDQTRQSTIEHLLRYQSIGGRIPLVLGGGPKVEILKHTPQDTDALNLRKFQVTEISRLYGVPGVLIGEEVSTWGSGIEELGRFYWRNCIQLHIERFFDGLEARMLSPGDRFYVDPLNLTRGDSTSTANLVMATQGDAQRPPVLTVEEIRNWLGIYGKVPKELEERNQAFSASQPSEQVLSIETSPQYSAGNGASL